MTKLNNNTFVLQALHSPDIALILYSTKHRQRFACLYAEVLAFSLSVELALPIEPVSR